MVIITPRRKHSRQTTQSFIERAIFVPTRSPIGVMASSTPNVKNIMPTTKSTAPNRNNNRILGESGAIVKLSSNTIPMMGNTALRASSNFSANLVW